MQRSGCIQHERQTVYARMVVRLTAPGSAGQVVGTAWRIT